MILIERDDGKPGIMALAEGVNIEDAAQRRRWLEVDSLPDVPTEALDVDWQTGTVSINPAKLPPLPPNWDGLNGAMLLNSEWQATTNIVRELNPGIVEALPSVMTQLSENKYTMFEFLFNQICLLAEVPQQQREVWAAIGENYNMPGQFLDIVRGCVQWRMN